jgi:hypothetical protein
VRPRKFTSGPVRLRLHWANETITAYADSVETDATSLVTTVDVELTPSQLGCLLRELRVKTDPLRRRT